MVVAGRGPDLVSVEGYVLDQLEIAVAAADLDGTIHRWNHHATTLLGWSEDEAVGRSLMDLLGSGVAADAVAILDQVRAGAAWEGEFPIRRKDETTILCRVSLSPLRTPEGNVAGIVGVSMDVTSDREAERRLAARTGVTRALAEAQDMHDAAPRVVQAVCEALRWAFGALWVADAHEGVLHFVGSWRTPSAAADEFVRTTRDRTFERGIGLPGRVWESAQPAWVPDVAHDSNFPRALQAPEAGLYAALATPIILGSEVLGVIEFLSPIIQKPDEALLQTMAVIGSQIGQFMERKGAEQELRRSRDQLEAIFQGVAEGITVQDRTGGFVFANKEAARMSGFDSVKELLEATPSAVMERFELLNEEGQAFSLEGLPGRVALQGEEPPEITVRFRRKDTGEERWSMVRTTAVRDEGGLVQLAINIFHDITERKRAEEAQRFLAEAGALLSASVTNYEETLARVAELAVPRLADWCAIQLRQEDGSIKTIKVAHVAPEKLRLAEELGTRYPPDPDAPTGVSNVLRTGRSELYPDIPQEFLEQAAVDEENLQIIRSLRLRSAMVVPLLARGRPIGAITLVFAESGRRYGPDDLALAEDLAARAGLAVYNAQLYRERDHIARTLQRSLLPPELPRIPHLEVAARYRAAGEGNEVGGDFYDVFETGDGGWAVIIGDVCGKGPEAAAVTGLARYTVRAAAMRERTPSAILTMLNDAIMQQRSDHLFCTVAYLRVRPHHDGTRITVCCAGHPLPLVVRRNGSVESVGRPGSLLGIFPDPELYDRPADLEPGDTIVLFTDGVTEERGPEELFGRDRLSSVLEEAAGGSAEEIVQVVDGAVTRFRPHPPRDDIAIVAAKALSP